MSVRNGILALLSEGPKHGFQLKKELEERTGALWSVNVGQVYTTLGRLERDGLVEAEGASTSDDQRPYRLTEAGRREAEEWFDTPRPRALPDRDELVVKVTLAVELGRDVQSIIDDQRRLTLEALQQHTRTKARADDQDLVRLFAIDAAITQIEAELRWLDLCESRLAAGTGHKRSRRGGR